MSRAVLPGEPLRLLAIDTSGPGAGLVLAGDGLVTTAALDEGGRARTEDLAAEASGLLAARGWTAADLSLLGAVTGPGSYTGLRSGLAFVRGLALPRDLPVVGVGALELMAESAAAPGERVLALWPLGGDRFAADASHGAPSPDAPDALDAVEPAGLDRLLASAGPQGLSAVVLPAWALAADGSVAEAGRAAAEAAARAGLPLRRGGGHLLPLLAQVVERKARRGLASPAGEVLPLYVGLSSAKPNRARVAVAAAPE